ncbi:MAG: prepilin-type N-terminal cleavage/methylation domain-containing protein [Victivallales bacterium]|nr:prepilin-type N-terminal cleavage/methylation domain-containing protein [Victivallales bacterium]
MVNRERTFRRNFTLVEILVVMAILAVLMGMGLGVYSLAMGAAKRSKTEALIKKIEIALETAKSKHGYYIQSMTNNHFIIPDGSTAIAATETTNPAMHEFCRVIDYESFKNGHTKTIGGALVVIDAWQRPLYYRCPGLVNTSTFDIISAGADGLVTDKKLWNDDWTLGGDVTDAVIKAVNPKTSDDLANF